MKKIITLCFIVCTGFCWAQSNTTYKPSNLIEMLFPEGKTKALLLSYDDGRIEDRRLVALMNTYLLVGTFHLNSNKLGTPTYLTKEEIKDLFQNHEVSVHTANHPNLTNSSKADIVYEIIEDRKALEQLTHNLVRGMAYPFGNNNDFVVQTIKDLGIEYARTVDDTYNFKIPTDFLRWHPSIHQFAKAYWEPNQPEKDQQELNRFYQLINDFLQSKEISVLDIWGHSWEMGTDENKWKETEKFFKLLANKPSIYYTTQIALVDYINAFRNLKFNVDKSMVTNQSALQIFFKVNNKTYSINPGKTITIE